MMNVYLVDFEQLQVEYESFLCFQERCSSSAGDSGCSIRSGIDTAQNILLDPESLRSSWCLRDRSSTL